jgi:hypothetical protein
MQWLNPPGCKTATMLNKAMLSTNTEMQQPRSLSSSNIIKPTDHRNGSQEKLSSAGAIRAIPAILMEMEDNYTFFLI